MRPPSYWRQNGINSESAELALRYHEGHASCQICGRIEPTGHNWVVDHDHSLEPEAPARGVLCSKCNSGLGFFDDDVYRLQAAIEYLETAPAKKAWGW